MQEGEDMRKICKSTENERSMLWELVALPSGRLEFRTNGGSLINSSSVTLDNNEFRVDSDDKDKDDGMVSLPCDKDTVDGITSAYFFLAATWI